MNTHRYRIIFNKLRGLMMVVAEHVRSHSAAAEPSAANGSGTSALTLSQEAAIDQTAATAALRPLAFSLMCALGLVAVVPNPFNIGEAHAEAIAAGNVPGNLRPTVLLAPNGVEVVNIQTPSAAGVSRNVYETLNVPVQGLIFNNSRSNVQTELGGWIQGNPWLATGTARVILNEVNSSHPSYLNGYMEIAGSRAELIIANPNGISCNGCGFINASRGVLTTGTPILSGGDLTGYRVTGGTVNIWGNGLDASRSNYTDIIARAVEVNAGIWANNLSITTGANEVNATNTQASLIAASGAAPASGIALDVAALGGMYAGKITLIGTEAGLGVRNAGVMNAATGHLTLTADGRLENTGSITSSGNAAITTSGSIGNSGTLYAQGNTNLTTQADISNSGIIAAQDNTTLTANGASSYISSSANAVLAAGLKTDGTLIATNDTTIATNDTTGKLNVSATQSVTAHGQNLSASDQTIRAQALDLSGSNTLARSLTLTASTGDIQAAHAVISASQTLTASTTQTLNTDGAIVSANQLNLTAHDLSNVGGELVQTGNGDTAIQLAGNLDNTQGRIATNSNNLTLAAQTITNTSGSIEHAGSGTLAITATTLNGAGGQVISNGALDLTASMADLNHGSTVAAQISLNTATLNHQYGEIIQTGTAAGSITATTQLDNSGGVIASNGNTTLTVGDLDNRGGTIQVSGQVAGTGSLGIKATGGINNSMLNAVAGSIQAGGALTIAADDLDNTQSEITAGDTLTIYTASNSSGLQNTQGLIASNQALTLNTASLNSSGGTVASVHNDVTITARAGSINNSAGQISAAQRLSSSSRGLSNTAGTIAVNSASINTQLLTLDNSGGSIMTSAGISQADLDLQTGALINDTGLIQSDGNLTVNTHGQTLTNSNSGSSKGILALGSSTFTTGDLNNQTGYIGARGNITAQSAAINNNSGSITGEASLTLNGSSLNNQAGRVEALGNVHIGTTTNIDNRSGLLRSGQALSLSTASLDNRNTQNPEHGIEGSVVTIDADQLDNSSGAVRADHLLAITGSGTLNNSSGLISSANTLNIADRLADANSNVAAKTLNITNTGGTIITGTGIAGDSLTIDSRALTGDGKVLSHGDLATKLTTDYTHSGEWQADGNATFTTSGNLTNQAKLLAGGNLDVTAANIDNQATGEIAGANLNITVADTLTNRGLLDGGDTFIHTNTLNNIGTGRIYGDHVAIATGTLTNAEETILDPVTGIGVTQAAVIAARDRLDIGAQAITNREHALLFSAGDMAIGGSLDQNHQATVAAGEPQVTSLINSGATIEAALGNLQLSVADLQNLNSTLVTQEVQIATDSFHKFTPRGRGEVLNADDFPLWQIGNFNISWRYGSTYNMPFNFREYYRYIGSTTTTETQVISSNPGQILSGGNLNISGNVTNSDSQIIAGGLLDISGASVQNLNSAGQTVKRYSGSAYYYDYDGNESCGDPKDGCYDISYLGAYNPANEVQTFSLNISRLAQLSPVPGTNTQVAALNTGSVSQMATGANNVNVAVVTAPNQGGNTQLAPVITNTQTGAGTIVRSVTPNTSLPNNSLYHTNPNPAGSYYVETDPRFANYRNWLSSDYMLKALSYDPAGVTKRLGDGFYEQRLIREQINQLTGRRFLTGYANDEDEYRALMTNGATFAQQYQLIPGVALTEAQIAQLTADIVWLVEKTITLADGSTVQALVPQVYVRLQPGELDGQGALLAGDSVHLQVTGDLMNSGSIAGRSVVTINADTINNLGGRMSANNTQLNARNDINNLGGRIAAQEALMLQAGHDINIQSTTQSSSNSVGLSSFSRTNLDRIAGLYMTNPNGVLVASAGNDITLQAAEISNPSTSSGQAGNHGITVLDAGHNLSLTTVTESYQNNMVRNGKNYVKEGATQEIGTTIQTEGDLILNAGNNVTARAANVTSEQGTLNVNAGHDLTIESGIATSNLASAISTKKKSTFSSKKTERRDTFNDSEVISSTFSGNQVNLNTGNDITITGSNVVGTQDVNLNAGNNINIEAAQATHDETHYYKEKKSGFSASSSSISYGSSKLTTTNNTQTVTNVGSTVGSVEGDVNINSGKQYTQTASDVLTPQGDINITAQQVDIKSGTDTYANQQTMKYKQSGITLAISNPVISAAQTVNQMAKASSQTSDPRLLALAAGTAAITASNASDALGRVDQFGNVPTAGNTGPNDMTNVREANAADQVGGINISLSIGTSKASSSSQQTSSTAASSHLSAGGNINITATGAGQASDINVIGSQLKAAHDLTLTADDQINLQAAQNVDTLNAKNKGSSASLGVSFGSDGFLITAGASGSKGKTNGNGTTWTETTIQGGNQQGDTVTLNSGTDTTLKGAQVIGNQVQANVGTSGQGNLNIESLQDTNQYKDKQQSIGGSISVGYGKMGGSFNYNDSKTKSNYQSVNEQSGIFAGDEGFQINVNGNTSLKGAVIASNEQAIKDNKNSLTTETLTVADIKNKAEYKTSSTSFGGGYSTTGDNIGFKAPDTTGASPSTGGMVGINQQGQATTGGTQTPGTTLPSLKGFSATMPTTQSASDQADSTTISGISGGTVNITDNTAQQTTSGQDATTTVANLNRDVTTQTITNADGSQTSIAVDSQGNNLANTLAPIYTEEVQAEIEAGFEITRAFVREVSIYVSHRTQEAVTIKQQAQSKLNEAATTDDPILKDLLQKEAANLNIQAAEIEANWGMGGDYHLLATALTGALSGNVTGSGTDIIQSAAVNYLQSLAASEIKDIADNLGSETARTALQAVAACAGAAAQGNDCGTGAMGASAAVVISNLIDNVNNSNASSLTVEEKQARENLVATLVTGIALAAGLDTSTANTAAQIELENNNLRVVVSTAKIIAKIGSTLQKTGKVTGTQLKEIIKSEGLDIVDDTRILLDGEINYEDALVLVNLITGIDGKALSKLEIADKLGSAISKVSKTEVRVVSGVPDVKYVPSPKHEPKGGWGTPMDLNPNDAQAVLNDAVLAGKQRYGFKDGKVYEFQPDNAGGWHGYPIPGNEAPAEVLRYMKSNGKISNSEYNKLISGR